MRDDDLTARARIRNAALELHARQGSANTTIREVAQRAGVTHGLVTHHFGSKAGLHRAVVDYFLERLREAIDDVPVAGTAHDIGRARDASVNRMWIEHPVFVDYLRRAAVDPNGDSEIVAALTGYTATKVREVRSAGIRLKTADDRVLTFSIMLGEIGPRVLAPLVEQVWSQLVGADATAGPAPRIHVWTERDTPSADAAPTPHHVDRLPD